MDRNKWFIAVLALAAAASFALLLYTASYDGWPTPRAHDGVLLSSGVLFVLLIVLAAVTAATSLRSRTPNVRTEYVMPAVPRDDEDDIKGKMPPAQN